MIKKYYEMLKRFLAEKKYLEFSLYILLILVLSTLVIIATAAFLSFIVNYFEEICFIVGGYVLIYFIYKEWRKGRQEEKLRQEEKHNAALTQLRVNESAEEKSLLESNYVTVRNCIHSVITEIAEHVNLKKPNSLSELDSPSRIIFKGNVPMCQFVVLKGAKETSTSTIKEILQTRITQRLSSNEFAGLTQTTYIYDGQAYPLLCIDEVCDIGNYLQVDVAWASENYCRLIQDRRLITLENQRLINQNVKDKDF